MVRPDLEMSSLSASFPLSSSGDSSFLDADLIRVHSGTVDIDDFDIELESGVERWKNRMFQEAMVFLFMYLPEKTGALLRSYVQNIQQNKEIWSGLVYAMFVEMMHGVNWTKPTSKEQAIQQLEEYLVSIKDRILKESLQDRGFRVI